MIDIVLFPLKVILHVINLAIWIVTFGWISLLKHQFVTVSTMRSLPITKPAHRQSLSASENGLAATPFSGVGTLYELSKRSFAKYAANKAMGTRDFKGQHNGSATVKEFGDVKWLTFSEVGEKANKFGAALMAAGLVPAPETTSLEQLKTPCSVALYENTSAEWMIAAQGCYTQSVIVTTIYATLGADAVIDSVADCNIKAIVCNAISVGMLFREIKRMKSLKLIIYTTDMVAPGNLPVFPRAPAGVTIISFDDFVAQGDVKAHPPTPPKPDTCAVIMFTSGSTGKPKGVVVTHRNLLSTVAAAKISLGIRPSEDVYLGYLPLAHILELMAEFCFIGLGCCVCYADPKTLTATGAYPIGALEQYSPTIMAGVPKIWDVIKKGVQAKIALASPVAQYLFKISFEARNFALSHGTDAPLFKALVFNKFAKVVGGRLRAALSGGGPLNSDVQEFVRTCFGCPLFQGYGLTETCAGSTIQDQNDLRCGIVGVPLSSCEIMLESVHDIKDMASLPYLDTDVRDVSGKPIFGRGEVLVKGLGVSSGYYMNPTATAEVYGSDGFFRTGDIGQFSKDGSLQIIDRKKNLVKLKGGEYIAIENMEMCYGNSTWVDAVAGGVCVYGDGEMDRGVIMIQINKITVMSWAKKNGVTGEFLEIVKSNKTLYDLVLHDLQVEGQKGGLSPLEKIVAVSFITDPWNAENGCLTAANKLQRREVILQFEKEFNAVRQLGIF